MANVNTFAAIYNKTGPTSSVETAIASVSGGTVRAYTGVPADIPAATKFTKFKVRAESTALASGACNFTQNIYWYADTTTDLLTFTDDKLLIGSSTRALASTNGTITQEVLCSFDPVTGQLAANWFDGTGIANIVTTPAIIKSSGAVASTNPVKVGITAVSQMKFFVTHTLSANATSSTLVELSLEQV